MIDELSIDEDGKYSQQEKENHRGEVSLVGTETSWMVLRVR